MTSKRSTLQHIAESLGISVNTASRALNAKEGVGEKTRERIQAEAERIGYVPNAHARSLVLGARTLIGLVITNASNPFYANLITEVEKHASAAGYSVVLFSSDESPERENEVAHAALRSGIDGVIVAPVQGKRNPWFRAQHAGVPVVVINRHLDDMLADLVRTDNHAGMYAATRHVIEQGARQLVLVEEDLHISTVRQRVNGYHAARTDVDLPVTDMSEIYLPVRRGDHAILLPWHADDAYSIATDLLDRGHCPDAFLTGNDYHALGIMRALQERGAHVPDDVIVVGYGDYPFSAFLNPSLSTVRLPARWVAQRAVELLVRRISGGTAVESESHSTAPDLVARESSRRLPYSVVPRPAGGPGGGARDQVGA